MVWPGIELYHNVFHTIDVMAKKNLQDRMDALAPYFRGIERYNDAIIVRVYYPSNWKAYESSDGNVKVTPSDDDPNETYYYADSNIASYDDIFDLIEETVKANEEVSLRLQLLKEKGEELKELFSRLPYEELKTLEFVVGTPKKKPRKSRKKPEKVEEAPQIEETNEAIEVIEE